MDSSDRVYNKVGGEKLVQAACWAHARRKFFGAVKVSPKDAAAIGMVDRMGAVSAFDTEARELSLTLEQRLALRLERDAATGVGDGDRIEKT